MKSRSTPHLRPLPDVRKRQPQAHRGQPPPHLLRRTNHELFPNPFDGRPRHSSTHRPHAHRPLIGVLEPPISVPWTPVRARLTRPLVAPVTTTQRSTMCRSCKPAGHCEASLHFSKQPISQAQNRSKTFLFHALGRPCGDPVPDAHPPEPRRHHRPPLPPPTHLKSARMSPRSHHVPHRSTPRTHTLTPAMRLARATTPGPTPRRVCSTAQEGQQSTGRPRHPAGDLRRRSSVGRAADF